MSSPSVQCLNCDTPLAPDAPGGVCPACLLGEAFDSPDTVAGGATTGLEAKDSNFRLSDALEGTTLGIGGRYKILQRIGEGGFGTVYMAEQTAPVRRRVAIKILKAGMDTHQLLARFEAERQALAMMDHPNIARVLDGGETEQGRPYFVMDLVRGDPITKYCNEESLSPNERLQLFLKVCRAVQHAHQKGIIHRDLKPSNILVTVEDGAEPVPKVIDFGVAKAMESNLTDKTLFTRFEQMIGTPAYMSPEQAGTRAAQDVDTRADIYALGVLLYELLTGTTPFEARTLQSAAFDEVRRILREEEAPRPSARLSSMEVERRSTIAKERGTEVNTLGKHLRGDLDWIVMKAIEKDRRRRYETTNALALDVERHLGDQPVTAGPPTVGYRMGKFLRRNKAGVGIAAVVLLSLISGLALATMGFARAKDEAAKARKAEGQAREAEARAENESTIARAINDFLVDDILGLAGSDESPAGELTIKTALDRAAERAKARLGDQPLVLAEVYEVLRDAYGRMGIGGKAIAQAKEAYRLLAPELGDDSRRTLYARYRVAHMLLSFGGSPEAWEECLAHVESTLTAQRRLLGEQDLDTLASLHTYLFAATRHRPDVDTIAFAREYVSSAQIAYASDTLSGRRLEASRTLAWVLDQKDRGAHAAEIESILEHTLEESIETLGKNEDTTLRIKGTLAGFFRARGRHAEAEDLYRQIIASYEALGGSNSPKLIDSYNQLAIALTMLNRMEEANVAQERAADIARANSPDRNADQIAVVVGNQAASLRNRGLFKEANQLLREVHPRILEESTEGYSLAARRFVHDLARSHMDLEQNSVAEELLREPVRDLIQKDGFRAASQEPIFARYLDVCLILERDLAAILDELSKLSSESATGAEIEGILTSTKAKAIRQAADRAVLDANWETALAHLTEIVPPATPIDDFIDSLRVGSVLLRMGRHDEARAVMQRFLNELPTKSSEPPAKILLLGPSKPGDPLLVRAGEIADYMTSDRYRNSAIHNWYCLLQGMAHHRSGQHHEAEPWLEKAKNGWEDCWAAANAFHALATAAQGKTDLARTELQAAEEAALKRSREPNPGISWFDNIIADLALEEARREIVLTGTPLISPTATWSFRHPVDGVDPASAMQDFRQRFSRMSFDDSSWPTGTDATGYEGGFAHGWPATTTWGTPEEGHRKSAYLRHRFSTTEPHTALLLHLRVDDGVIVYLDGNEVGRFNIAADETDRYGLTAERELSRFERANHRLIRLKGNHEPGEHVLALSVHNASDTSPDLGVGSISLYGTPPVK